MRRHANLGAKSLSPALEAIAANVIVLRARRRISQGDLAERSGVSRATVSRIERAEGDTSVLTLQQIAAALGVAIAEIALLEVRPLRAAVVADAEEELHAARQHFHARQPLLLAAAEGVVELVEGARHRVGIEHIGDVRDITRRRASLIGGRVTAREALERGDEVECEIIQVDSN